MALSTKAHVLLIFNRRGNKAFSSNFKSKYNASLATFGCSAYEHEGDTLSATCCEKVFADEFGETKCSRQQRCPECLGTWLGRFSEPLKECERTKGFILEVKDEEPPVVLERRGALQNDRMPSRSPRVHAEQARIDKGENRRVNGMKQMSLEFSNVPCINIMSVLDQRPEDHEMDIFLAVLKARCVWNGVGIDADLELVRMQRHVTKTVAALIVELLRACPSEATARLLESCTQSVENRVALIGAGAVPAVVEVLSSGTKEAKAHAASILRNFSFNDQNEIAIVRAGAVPPLVALLKSDDVIVGGIGAGALRELSYNGQNKMVIVEAGAIPALVALLSIFSKLEVKATAAMALTALSEKHFQNQIAVVAGGAIPPLVTLLEDGPPDHDCRAEAAMALFTLSANGQNQPIISASGAIGPLVLLLSCRNPKSQTAAAGALWNVCFDAKSQVAAAALGAILPLVGLLMRGSPDAQCNAVGAIYSLSLASQNHAAIVEAGAVPPLERLQAAGSIRQKELAAKTLRNLADVLDT